MLLQSLYEFAKHTKGRHGETLLSTPQFDSRYIAWLIDIESDGTFKGFFPLMNDNDSGTLYDKLPRSVEPKDSGTVAEFLVEDVVTILGLGATPSDPMKEKAREKHKHFWSQIQTATAELSNPYLKSILNWHEKTLTGNTIVNPVYETYQKPDGRGKAKQQWLVVTPLGVKRPLYFKPNTSISATFRIEGNIVVYDEAILDWWKRWFDQWLCDREKACRAAHGSGRVCVVSGEVDASISNSHLPKIKGVPGTTGFGATLASAESDSYHSYGLSIQQAEIPGSKKAPDASYTNVSVRSAITYCDSLNYLLRDEDHHVRIDPLVFCFWCRRSTQIPKQINMLIGKAYPEQVESLLKSQFVGVEPTEVLHQERLYTLALSGNSGRIMVQQWIDQTLTEAIANLQKWWDDLQVIPLHTANGKKEKAKRINESKKRSSPYAVRNLAEATVRKSKKRKDDRPVGERVLQLYLAALKNTAPSLSMLKPILDEFHSALVKNDEKNPTYPFSQSRFALIKLILIRNGENKKGGGFMPTYYLAETPDPAYNLGRLLAVFESLQDKYHNSKKKGPGVVERYYATASSAPGSAFPILCRLARHHLSKVRREDGAAAYRIEERIAEIMSKFQPEFPNEPPTFPRVLTLEQQGRFALGFYQQKAYHNSEIAEKKQAK